ncbi:hypothetical protein J524_4226, partial [Acinetobacter baumannii 496487]
MDLGKVKKYCLVKSRFIAAVYGGFLLPRGKSNGSRSSLS